MYSKTCQKCIALTATVFLLLSPGVVNAQDGPGAAASDQPAATESMVEESTTLDVTGAAGSEAAAKSGLQAQDKAVASETTVDADEAVKAAVPSIFLPMVSMTDSSVSAAETQAYWRTLRYEGFEGIWPGTGWRTYDCNGTTGGTYYWDDESYKPYVGYWSAWPAGSALNPRYYYYPNNACTWMIYGPFNLYYAQYARMLFYRWNQTELNYDYIGWYVSCNNYNFYGYRVSGDSGGWRSGNLSLNRCLGDSTVWIGFKFTSDSSIVDDGPFIDHIYVQEYR